MRPAVSQNQELTQLKMEERLADGIKGEGEVLTFWWALPWCATKKTHPAKQSQSKRFTGGRGE